MIIFGTTKNIAFNNKSAEAINTGKMKVFNLCSISEKGEKLFNLIPPFSHTMYEDMNNRSVYEDPETEYVFDVEYCKYILENDNAFMDLMKIIYPEYEHSSKNISYILIEEDDIRLTLVESLQKFIQQRYGIDAYWISMYADWELLDNEEPNTFTVPGLYNFDADKERYSNMLLEQGYIDKDSLLREEV